MLQRVAVSYPTRLHNRYYVRSAWTSPWIPTTEGTKSLFSTSSFVSSSSSSSSSTNAGRPFDKVLIANRGEIACRVIRTCKTLGIPTVALYSVADGPQCLHAKMADEAYRIGTGPTPTESYLLQQQVVEIALQTGAQAIHPGYGFLSENAQFCELVAETDGVTFIGPPVPAITAMGSKSKSKAIMEAAGVPTTPGYYGDDNQDPEYLLERARMIGFPCLIKAVMGGGGKGMRLVWSEAEFLTNLEACQRESLNSFADSRVLLEKYLVRPRHVEVQVVADHHGNVVHLYERDCSLQRRHQKIIEEAPASDLPIELRHRLGEMGKRAAQAVGYVNAGTVEFLLDTQQPDQFYFCEMNTRLQVEHPISELITGVDLVEWQLRIAAGEELPITDQAAMPCIGHAFEARMYAENPARGFLPAVGKVWHHQPPASPNEGIDRNGVRVDTGIQAGQEVGVYYDPMICKLIVHDETREKALTKLVDSLKRYQIAGVPTNIDFLVRCAEHDTFKRAGEINTGFLDDYMEAVLPTEETGATPALGIAIGVYAAVLKLEGRIGIKNLQAARQTQHSPWNSLSGSWIMGGNAKRRLQLLDGTSVICTGMRDGSCEIEVLQDDGDSATFHIDGTLSSDREMDVIVNHTQRITLTTVLNESDGGLIQICMWPQSPPLMWKDHYSWEVSVENPLLPSSLASPAASLPGQGTVRSPMPGKISRINFSIGDFVEEGEVLMLMEAMKMEHAIHAPSSGILSSLSYQVNDVVADGVVLAILEEQVEQHAV